MSNHTHTHRSVQFSPLLNQSATNLSFLMRLSSYKQLGSSMPSFPTYFIYKPHQCFCLRAAWELQDNVRRWKYGCCLLCGVIGTGGHVSVCLRAWLRYLPCTNWRKPNVTRHSLYGFTTRVKGLNMLTASIMSTSHGGRFTCKTNCYSKLSDYHSVEDQISNQRDATFYALCW